MAETAAPDDGLDIVYRPLPLLTTTLDTPFTAPSTR